MVGLSYQVDACISIGKDFVVRSSFQACFRLVSESFQSHFELGSFFCASIGKYFVQTL